MGPRMMKYVNRWWCGSALVVVVYYCCTTYPFIIPFARLFFPRTLPAFGNRFVPAYGDRGSRIYQCLILALTYPHCQRQWLVNGLSAGEKLHFLLLTHFRGWPWSVGIGPRVVFHALTSIAAYVFSVCCLQRECRSRRD